MAPTTQAKQIANENDIAELIRVFNRQIKLQYNIVKNKPIEPILSVYNSATSAIIEIGEMLQENTSWKRLVNGSKKEPCIDNDKFLEEYCDVILYVMNIAIYAGIDAKDIIWKLSEKQKQNFERFNINE